MGLLKHDEEYLKSRDFEYTITEGTNELFLVLRDYKLSSEYSEPKTNVLIRIPVGYPMVGIDMFFVKPHIKVVSTNMNAPATEGIANFIGSDWQQFSRHYEWKPTYNLETHIKMVDDVLGRGRWQ